MIVDDEILFDAFTPINVLTGAIGRYRGARLSTMLVISLALEIAENAFLHYYGDLLPTHPREHSRNVAVGMMATAVGWGVTDAGLRGAFQHVD